MERANSRHHFVFPEAEQSLRPEGQFIRTHPSLIRKLTRPDHDIVHQRVSIIPALGHNTLRAVSRLWVPDNNSYRSLDNLMLAIDEASKHPKSSRIETALAQLTIEALELEKSALKDIGYKDGR